MTGLPSSSILAPGERQRGASREGRSAGAAVALGVFAAAQTFILFAGRDRFAVLFWWTKESWLLVTLLWLKDLALAGVAFFVFFRIARWTETLPDPFERHGFGFRLSHGVLFGAILAAGVALRWIAPRQIPPGVWGDALAEAGDALRRPGKVPWLGGQPLGEESHVLVSHVYMKFCEAVFRLFGRGDVGILALSAIGGSLSLPAAYWLGRETSGRHVAIVATALLALGTSPLAYSRWAWTASLLLPFLFGAAAATVRALATGRAAWAIVAGLLLGLSLHTYVSSWVAAAGFAAFALTAIQKPYGKRLVFAAAVATLLAFLPYGFTFLEHPERLGGRAREVSFLAPTRDVTIAESGPAMRLLHNAVEYSGFLLWTGDPDPKHGLPGRPAVNAGIGVAALAGIALYWRKARTGSSAHRLLLLLAAASLLAGIFSNPMGAPFGLRVYPFIGVAIFFAAESLCRWTPAATRALGVKNGTFWALGLSVFLLLETLPFLTVWPDDGLVIGSFCPAESAGGRLAQSLGAAPTILNPKALPWPIVFETLAAGRDPDRPVPRLARRTAADLLDAPPREAFWYVARQGELDRLCAGVAFHCARGVSVDEATGDTVIARVVPALR